MPRIRSHAAGIYATLYCTVSDIWIVRDKWQRIAVSLAGMWIEAAIAATCTLLWWFSSPGLFHSLCLNLMFLCGVSTFVFNGNPLLRYDGYFALSDWLEIPNLQQQSAAIVRARLLGWFLYDRVRRRPGRILATELGPLRVWIGIIDLSRHADNS